MANYPSVLLPIQKHITGVMRHTITPAPDIMVYGAFKGVQFTISVDDDGHIEAFFSGSSAKPRAKVLRLFFSEWGIEPLCAVGQAEIQNPNLVGFIVRDGTMH